MHHLKKLFEQNEAWANSIKQRDPEFFRQLSRQQNPEFLWIGCSDSRVPANEIIGVLPGEVFVHRNLANVVVHTDLNCLSVVQLAVDLLQVKHIFVVGHYGCGGVGAVVRCQRIGLADNWLRHVQDVRDKHHACLGQWPDDTARSARLCELNVIEQVASRLNHLLPRCVVPRPGTDGPRLDLRIEQRPAARPEDLGQEP